MAKKKIKTSRYFTRICDNCGFEMANWFVQCPKCKQTWNSPTGTQPQGSINSSTQGGTPKPIADTQKTIRIIAQLTEDDIKINGLTIFFSADNGVSWFSMPMKRENDYFVAEIENVALFSTIIYYLKGIDENGMEFVEDNDAKFYYYNVTEYEDEQGPIETDSPKLIEDLPKEIPNKMDGPKIIEGPITFETTETEKPSIPLQKAPVPQAKDSGVIFTPLNQAKKETNLKICPHCKSKIKADWSICPICGGQQ